MAGEVGGVCVSVAKSFFQTSVLFALVGLGVDDEGDTTSLLVLSAVCFAHIKSDCFRGDAPK